MHVVCQCGKRSSDTYEKSCNLLMIMCLHVFDVGTCFAGVAPGDVQNIAHIRVQGRRANARLYG